MTNLEQEGKHRHQKGCMRSIPMQGRLSQSEMKGQVILTGSPPCPHVFCTRSERVRRRHKMMRIQTVRACHEFLFLNCAAHNEIGRISATCWQQGKNPLIIRLLLMIISHAGWNSLQLAESDTQRQRQTRCEVYTSITF